MPYWAWFAIVFGAVLLAIFVITIKNYPEDNSF